MRTPDQMKEVFAFSFICCLLLHVREVSTNLKLIRELAKNNTDFALEFYGVLKNIAPKEKLSLLTHWSFPFDVIAALGRQR